MTPGKQPTACREMGSGRVPRSLISHVPTMRGDTIAARGNSRFESLMHSHHDL